MCKEEFVVSFLYYWWGLLTTERMQYDADMISSDRFVSDTSIIIWCNF